MKKLVLLGTAGYHPSEHRHTTCAMLPEDGIVIDAGTSMFRVRDHIVTDTLDIFLTHAHLDHTIGLTFLFDVIFERPLKRITVHAAADKLEALRQHLFTELLFPVDPPFEMRPITGELVQVGSCSVGTFPLPHPGGSLGLRFDWPERAMAYITDTMAAADADYISQLSELDLLVHECFFADGYDEFAEKTGHSCAGHVGSVAKATQPKQLVLTHFNPLDNVEPPIDLEQVGYPGTKLGEDRMVVEF